MNKEEQEFLDSILAKDPSAITESDAAILAARVDYLTEDQKATFGIGEPKKAKASKE